MSDIIKKTKEKVTDTWLIVGGCPRSGTTILGNILREHPNISLFHEMFSHKFFNSIESIYKDYHRMSKYDFIEKEYLPNSDQCDEIIINAIFNSTFSSTFGEKMKIVGTKMPGYYSHPDFPLPKFMKLKIIHITRDPFKCAASFLVRMEKESLELFPFTDIHHVISEWTCAWNRAVDNSKKYPADQFLHVFYDDLVHNPDQEFEKIHSFLEVKPFAYENHLKKNTLRNNETLIEQFQAKKWNAQLDILRNRFSEFWEDWISIAKNRWCEKQYMAAKYTIGEKIDFHTGGNSLRYTHDAFNGPELDGTWLQGKKSTMLLKIPAVENKPYLLKMRSSHICCPNGHQPHVEIFVNQKKIFDKYFNIDDENENHSALIPKDILQASGGCKIVFKTNNPLVPAKVLDTSNDQRALGIMLSSLSIE